MAVTLKELVENNRNLKAANLSMVRLVSIGSSTPSTLPLKEEPINPKTKRPYGKETKIHKAWKYRLAKTEEENKNNSRLNTRIEITAGPEYKGSVSIVYRRECIQELINTTISEKGPLCIDRAITTEPLKFRSNVEELVYSFLKLRYYTDVIVVFDSYSLAHKNKITVRLFTKNDFSYVYTAPGGGAVIEINIIGKNK